uniref:Ig-like domain-containing protein n=1 Tax=Oreochromis niloticus TaxID=8128 RepID=I3JD16_ORENI
MFFLSASPVIVKEDDDAILPCSIGTNENIESMLFVWKKEGTVPLKQVFMYDDGTYSKGQDEEFKGRVSYFPEQLKHGNASIRMKKTRLEDKGNYTCSFPIMQPEIKIFHIELVVGAAPEPSVTNLNESSDWALLKCDVKGAYPEPTVEWWNSNNQTIPSEEPQVSKEGEHFYVTLKTTVKKTDYYRCVATQKEIHHQIYTEINVHLNEQTVIVKEGDDAILSCSPKTKESIESKPFSWTKEGPAGQKKVFLYDTSNNDLKGQDKQFKDRVSHFPEGLKHGDASITIKNTKVTDTGKYICSFPHLQPQRKAEIFLLVDALSGTGMIKAAVFSVVFGMIGVFVAV